LLDVYNLLFKTRKYHPASIFASNRLSTLKVTSRVGMLFKS